MAVPTKDATLVAWSNNFDTRITATPADYGLTAAQATAYNAKHGPFVAAYEALVDARAAGVRSEPLTAAKQEAKRQLLLIARELYGFIQDNTSVSDAEKIEVGVTPKSTQKTSVGAPTDAPAIDIVSVFGNTARVRLHDATSVDHRAKPDGVLGAAVFSFVGANPPTSEDDWNFEGNTTKTMLDIVFPAETAPGAKVWITAYWFNTTTERGPAAAAVGVHLPGGGSMAA